MGNRKIDRARIKRTRQKKDAAKIREAVEPDKPVYLVNARGEKIRIYGG